VDTRSLYDGGVSLIFLNLCRKPLELLQVAGIQRQNVGAILPVQRAVFLQLPPDTNPLAGSSCGEPEHEKKPGKTPVTLEAICPLHIAMLYLYHLS
jgi:hypothetical protein